MKNAIFAKTILMMRKLLYISLMFLGCAPAGARDYSILDYGAVSDTTRLSTDAVQRTIDQCAADGGGRVVVPAGNYNIGTLVLRTGVELHLESGATLYGSTRLSDYRPMRSSYVSLLKPRNFDRIPQTAWSTCPSPDSAPSTDEEGRLQNSHGMTRASRVRICCDSSSVEM